MELPILTTKHAGIPELVEDGINGYLVDEKDIDALLMIAEAYQQNDKLNESNKYYNKVQLNSEYLKQLNLNSYCLIRS